MEMTKKQAFEKLKEDFPEIDETHNRLMDLLSTEKRPYKSMAIGEHNGNYYFGSIVEDKGQKIPVIITDDKKKYWRIKENTTEGPMIIDEIRDKFQLNYRFELFDDCIDNLWSNESIKNFLEGNAKEFQFLELFNAIREKNKELVYHPDDRVHSYIACDIISNYYYPLFNAKGRTYFQADFGSGKSRQSLIYQKLSFNSLFASNISPASFERVIESTGGTIIVDNFDNLADDLKRLILQCLEVYYKKGGKNIKADGNGERRNKPIAFNGYSPLVINNIVGLPEVTESRCNKIQMLKTDKKNIVDKKINEKDSFWHTIKDSLHILALQRWKEVRQVYDSLEVPELSARDLERAEAVLTIAKCIGPEVYSEVLSYLLESNEQHSIREVSDSWEFMLFEYLHLHLVSQRSSISVKGMSEDLAHKIVVDERNAKSDLHKFSRYAGKILSGISLFRKKIIHGWVFYEIDRDNLDRMIKIKGFDKYLKQPHPTSPTTPTSEPIQSNLGDKGDKGDNGFTSSDEDFKILTPEIIKI